MAKHDVQGIDDLLPGLQNPLWQGEDPEFAQYVREAFGVPESFRYITIAPRGSAGRAAVAIGDDTDGAIIFALTPASATQNLHIRPLIIGPVTENADVVERSKQSKGKHNSDAIRAVLARHLADEVVRGLLKEFH
jgi:hypothetical protein